MALPRSCGGNASSSTACESGCIAPPVAPCSSRNPTRNGRFGAMPQSSDEIVNPATDVISSRLRPKCPASHPVSGRTMALATRYEVSTHVDSSIVADRLPAMCGSDTLTTVVSSTSMKVANMTATDTIHGFTVGADADNSQLPTSQRPSDAQRPTANQLPINCQSPTPNQLPAANSQLPTRSRLEIGRWASLGRWELWRWELIYFT